MTEQSAPPPSNPPPARTPKPPGVLSWLSLALFLAAIVGFVLRQPSLALTMLLLHWMTGALVLIRQRAKN